MTLIDKNPIVKAKYWEEQQAIVSHYIAPPVQNTWYTILDTTENANIKMIVVKQDAGEP